MSPRVLAKVMEMLLSLVRALFGRRADLALENLALRQQVAALKRERPDRVLQGPLLPLHHPP